jgi:hypothetical protein
MTVSLSEIRKAWIDAALQLWEEPVRDIQRGQPKDPDRIQEMCEAIGWGDWFLDNRGSAGYDEGPGERWCGIGQAYIASEMLPEVLGADVELHPDVVAKLLPSTDKLYAESRWQNVGLPRPSAEPEDIEPGMIVTVGNGPDGSHVVLVRDVVGDRYTTIECNGTGVLGDGRYGEGVVRRYDVEGVTDYEGDAHTVRSRPISGIKQVYPFGAEHFVGTDAP